MSYAKNLKKLNKHGCTFLKLMEMMKKIKSEKGTFNSKSDFIIIMKKALRFIPDEKEVKNCHIL